MFESLQFLPTLATSLLIGNLLYLLYQLLIGYLRDTFGKNLRKEPAGLFETGLLLIGLVDVLGGSVLSLGVVVCVIAVFWDFADKVSEN